RNMYRAAREALESAQTDKSVRVILFGAEGEAFTAGNDLGDFSNASKGKGEEPQASAFINAIARAEKPIVAAVPGISVGVGTTMLLHCDLVYVADDAKLSAPFVNLALVPEAGSSFLMPARIGYVRAFALFALGESLAGQEAVTLGIANKALPWEDLLPAARTAAQMLVKKPAGSLVATKKLMRDTDAVLRHMAAESKVFGERLKSDEAREAFSAFAERRQPDFSQFNS
uniref:enoyl-CoA hydratase-related protein n=1 Tax=uncultured Marinobacter sp. TaxID=187379 RepID=UPI0030D99AC9